MNVIRQAMNDCPDILETEMLRAIERHEQHARFTGSAMAHRAATRLADSCRIALGFIKAGEASKAGGEIRFAVPASECAERALRQWRVK